MGAKSDLDLYETGSIVPWENSMEAYRLNAVQRLFYMLKLWFCIILRKHRRDFEWDYDYYGNEFVMIVSEAQTSWDGDRNWEELCVGRGYFKNWYYRSYPNGT